MTTLAVPEVEKVTRHAGVAGQFSVAAEVTYPDEPTETVTFVGSVYGGPVVMVTPSGAQHFVTAPERFGQFGIAWVWGFFGYATCSACGKHETSSFAHGIGDQRYLCADCL